MKKFTASALGLPNLRDIKQCVGKDNQVMINILVAHNKELVRQQATAGNWGWVISDTGICSKTSKGYLSTDASGSKWETYVSIDQVRKHYEDRGCEVYISEDGHVEYSRDGKTWSEGRWVSEYRIRAGEVVLT